MTFTYDTANPFTLDRDKIRSKVQDTVENSGVKPDGVNFSDEFIAGLLTDQGNVNRTVAALYETLATAWANYVNTEMGPRREDQGKIADNYMKLAKQWRNDYGYAEGDNIIQLGSLDEGISEDEPT